MSGALLPRTLPLPRTLGSSGLAPGWVIAGHIARSSLRWAALWGFVFGLFVIGTVKGYVVGYPTVADRLKVVPSLQSFSILLGQPQHAETVAGFTSWRVLVVIALIGSIWGLLTSTGLLRGEEEAGRWELLLAGQTTKRRAAAQALLGLGVSIVVMFVIAVLLTLAAGRLPGARFTAGGSVLFGLAMVSGAAMFVGVGAVASQLSATRGQAAMLTGAVLGASYLTRMVADSTAGLGWLRWFTPIGWVEEVHPLRDPQPLALLPVLGLVAVCAIATVVLAGRRDLYGSVLQERVSRSTRSRLLAGPTALAIRLIRPTALGWLFGIVAISAVQGYVTRSASTLFASSPAFTSVLGRLGVRKASEAYLGVSFLTIAVLIAVVAASQIGAVRDEEASGRLDNILVRPVKRLVWLGGRVAVSFGLLILCGALAGLATWIGAASQHAGVSLQTLLEAGMNATVPAIFVLGAGVFVLGVRPRLTVAVAYGIVAWSFLVQLVGSIVKGNDWLRDSSLFAHMALAPAAKPDWPEAGVVMLLGAGLALLGAALFRRRDLEYS